MVFGAHPTPSRRYTAAEEARIREGAAAGVSDRALADGMGRSRRSVASKRVSMGITHAPALRKNAVPVVDVVWDPVEVDVDTLCGYAALHKLAATPEAVNAFRRTQGLPEWSVNLRRWAA